MQKKRGQGEGTISKRSNGTWCGRITIGKDENGKQKRKAFYGKTKVEVQKKMISAQNDLNNGVYTEPSNFTVEQWLDIWLAEYKKNFVKPTSYTTYRTRINTHIKPAIGKYKLKDLRIDLIQKMINNLKMAGLAPETIKGVYNTAHSALEQAVTNGIIPKNVASKVLIPKSEKKEIKIFSLKEQVSFIEVAKTLYMGELFMFSLGTGMRIGEILALTWDDINFDEHILKVRKTLNITKDHDDPESKWQKTFGAPKTETSTRTIPLLPNVEILLKEIKRKQNEQRIKCGSSYENNNLVFTTGLGKPLDPRNMQRKFTSILKKADIQQNMHIHCLRHTFASRGLENGIELKVMQELLGHSSIKMTADLYTHVLLDKKKSAMAKLQDTLTF